MSHPRTALLFSGQGAQTVGMGQDLAFYFPTAAALFEEANTLLQMPLSQIMFEGPSEKLTQTALCQPALYVHGLVCLALLKEKLPHLKLHAAAGLSLGEFTAHAAAGTFDFATGLKLVEQRAQFMQEACEETEGSMAAMIGAEEEVVYRLASVADVDVANFNAPGQIVISGDKKNIAKAIELAKEHGIRKAIELQVAGAFHSRLMNSARLELKIVLESTPIKTPHIPVISNIDAKPAESPERIRQTLADQVTGSVRWRETIEYLIDECQCTRFLELGPGGIIAGLVNRIRKGTEVISISDTATLEAAVEILSHS
ncbi:MAG: ACP S-malonyltransferase [Verrucomicrobiae bacterium]|jgi:[acyl-carrier-protein] S-malonyltransferase|nr:ACP S-malonyltransferase [Verrucomicrobiae bacterium]